MAAREDLARRVAERFADVPSIVAVALGGSTVCGSSDAESDIDCYVYTSEPLALDLRRQIAAHLGGSAETEIGNEFWEPGDEWCDQSSRISVDVMYRQPVWLEDQLERLLIRHEACLGYSTCLWHNVYTSSCLFDRDSWYHHMQEWSHQPYPEPLRLTFIHNLQTELKSEMNALQQRLDMEPALPQSFPTGRTITLAGQIAAQLGDGLPEGSCSHQRGSLTYLRCHNGKQIRIEDLLRRALRLTTGQIPQAEQTDCQWRQQAQQANQTVGALDLARFELAARFEALVVVLHDPAALIPPDALPGLLERRGRDRGHQNPFQRLFSAGGLLFPNADRPPHERFLAAAALEARRQQRDRTKSQLHHGRASRTSMTAGHAKRSAGLPWPAAHHIEQMSLRALLWRDPSVLTRAYQKLGLCRLASLKEREQISATIPDMHNRGLGGKTAQPRHQAHPHIRFPLAALPSLAARLSCWSRDAHPGLLQRTAYHRAALRQDGQHRLQIQPSPAFIADLAKSLGFGMVAQVHFGGVLDQQHYRPGFDLFPRLVPMRLHQRLKGYIRFLQQSVHGDHIFPRLHLGWQGRRGVLRHPGGRLHSSSRSANIFELAGSKRLFSPAFWIQNCLCVHLPIVARVKSV